MRIGSHKNESFGGKFEQYARHNGAHIVVTAGEQGFLNGRSEDFGSYHCLGYVLHSRQTGVLVGVFIRDIAFTFVVGRAVAYLEKVFLFGCGKSYWLFGKCLEYFREHFGRDRYPSVALSVDVYG